MGVCSAVGPSSRNPPPGPPIRSYCPSQISNIAKNPATARAKTKNGRPGDLAARRMCKCFCKCACDVREGGKKREEQTALGGYILNSREENLDSRGGV